jgi:hypothetical protein
MFPERRYTVPVQLSSFIYIATALLFFNISLVSCKYSPGEEDDERLEMDGMEKAMKQEFFMTRDPALNIVPTERLLSAMRYMSNARTTQTNDLTWQERGPDNIGGRSRAIMIDKHDPTGNTVFAASVSGGIFKTTNFTSPSVSWAVVDDHMANLAVTVLVQDKNNLNIMYAGTGEGWFNVDAVKGAGIFKSSDGGVTWTQLSSTAQFEYVQDIVIDNNSNVYAALRNLNSTNRGVMRSTNGGTAWTQVLGIPLTDLAYTTGRAADLEVASNGDIYATLGIFTRTMVLKSSFAVNGANTGAAGTWIDITPSHSNITFRGEIAIAPSNPQKLYLMMQDSATDKVLNFYTSSNGGTNWTSTNVTSGSPLDQALNNGSSSQTWYDLICAVDSTNANIVVVGGIELAKSTDGGASWSALSSSSTVHVDQHALVFLNSSNLLIGNDGGIYYTANFTSASPGFTQKNNGFNVTQFYGCDFHPTDPNYFLAGAQDNNTQKFTTAGINSTTPVVGGDGGIPHIRQTDGVLQIAAATNNTYYRSLNSGGSFSTLGSVNNGRGQFINPSDLDDTNNTLYTGDDIGQYYCITGLDATPAGTTKSISQMGDRAVTTVKIDPVATNTIWIGASNVEASTTSLQPVIIKITNANVTPTVTLTTTIASGNGSYISSIDVDPSNTNNVLVTVSNFGVPSVWQSTNGGTSFTNIEGNLPDMPVLWGLYAPAGAQLSGTASGGIILGTDLGVWTTSAVSGSSTQWIANNSGLANVPVYMIKYRSANTSLVAATHGRGLFTTTLTGVVTSVSNNVITKNFIKYISPDASQLLVVKGDLNVLKMQVQIFDAMGKLMYNKEYPYQDLSIPISTFSKGSYIIRIQGNKKENFVQQFVKR